MNGYKITLVDEYGFVFGEEYLTMNPDDNDFSEIDGWIEEIIAAYKELYFGHIYAEVEAF